MAITSACARKRATNFEVEEMSHEDLLSSPTEEGETFEKVHTRSSCSYEDLCHRYRLEEQRNYVTQYAHIYFTRLTSMREYLESAAVKKWSEYYLPFLRQRIPVI